MREPDLIIIDGSNYLYRAYHVAKFANMTTSDGRPSGTIKLFASMVHPLLKYKCPIVITFDKSGKNFRHKIYKEYKANRDSMPDDLRPQVAPIKRFCKAMGIHGIVKKGVEADDVIGTLAVQATEAKMFTWLITGDKDLAQFVNKYVTCWDTKSDERLDIKGVEAKFGITPKQVSQYLALVGDKVDNIPGVDSCGPKTAVKWLQTYGNLRGIVDNAGNITGKIGEKLRASIGDLKLSYKLAKIKTDVALKYDAPNIPRKAHSLTKMNAILHEYEIKPIVLKSGGLFGG